jgi:PAS domain S-box-containing protein
MGNRTGGGGVLACVKGRSTATKGGGISWKCSLQKSLPTVAVLSDLLRASTGEAGPRLAVALGQLATLVRAGEVVVYLPIASGSYESAHRAVSDDQGCAGILPQSLTAAQVASCQEDVAETAGMILVPMRGAGQVTGILGCGAAPAGQPFGVEQIAILRLAADLLGMGLAPKVTDSPSAAALAALQDQMFEVDAEGRLTGLLAGPPHLVAEASPGMDLAAAVPGEAAAIVAQAFRQVMETGAVTDLRFRHERVGEIRHFELSGNLRPAKQPEGRPAALFLVRDVTRDAKMRDDLQRLGKIVESMDNLVAILDAQMCVVWVNAAFENHTGWPLDEVRGKRLGAVVRSPESDPGTVAKVNAAIDGKAAFKGQVLNQDRHGNRYWVDFNIVPLLDAEGGLQGYVSIETVVTKLKEQEIAMARLAEAAEAARIRLENAIHALPDGVVIFDAEDRLVAVNSAYHRTFPELAHLAVPGVTLETLLRAGLDHGAFLATASVEKKEAWLQSRLADYQQPYMVDEVQLPDGRWMRRINTRTMDGGLVALGIDVTHRHNQIAALDAANRDLMLVLADRDRAERRLTGIIDGAEVGTWELDVDNDRLHIGGHWGEILGLETRSLTGLTVPDFLELVHPDDQARLHRPRDFGPGPDTEIVNTEFRMRHRDGHWVWILSRSRVARRGVDGTPQLISGVHLDISERKLLEQEIATSRAFLQQVMDTSIAAIVVLDASGTVSYANREASHVLWLQDTDPGLAPAKLVLERVEGGPLADADLPFQRVQKSHAPVRDIQCALLRPDGARRILSCNAAPLATDQDGGLSLVVMSFSDITDDLAAKSRLEEALNRAEEMSQAKSTFLANMSHEIRTPLNGVLGMAEVLADSVTEPVQRRMIDTIRKSGETLLTVLNGILDMSKIEAGKMELEQVPFIPADLIRQVEAIYAVAAEEKGISFEVFGSAGCDRPRLGDPHRIMQILNNLLNNAVKFTEKGSVTLKLSCRTGKPMVIEVSDTGTGIDPSQVARVFESFEQADGSMTRRFGGTGLGLAIVRQLVTLMGGEISADSAPGRGTKFKVVLPLAETEMQQSARASVEDAVPPETALTGVRILGADDNATNRLVLAEMLAKSGAALVQVENGQEAIDAWLAAHNAGKPYALILMDITMPVLDGMSALAKIRYIERARGFATTPAIAITAHAMPHQVSDYIIGGFDTHLAKPFRQRDLLHAVHSLLQP